MAELVILRALPGAGKTTKARAWVAEDRANRVRVNRDDLRSMVDDSEYVKGVTEGRILALRDVMITQALKRGLDVISDDTNLPARTVKDLAKLAYLAGADFRIEDMTDVPLETCLKQNDFRVGKGRVLPEVIMGQYNRFIRGKDWPLPVPDLHMQEGGEGEVIPYVPDESLPKAIIVDIDGTVALKGTRDAFDETRVHEDRPNTRVIEDIRTLWTYHTIMGDDLTIIFMSGRTDGCREATQKWLEEHVKLPFQLYMRAKGDGRKDWIVKNELFALVRDKYNVLSAWDDRNQVVDLWRNKLNLQTYQVADGAFLSEEQFPGGIMTGKWMLPSTNVRCCEGGALRLPA